jgi:hypothetical protein
VRQRLSYLIAPFICCALMASAGTVTYNVTVNTSSISGTTGSLDFNFSPGPLVTQSASLQILDFTSDGTPAGNCPCGTGDVAGQLPATLTFDNATGFNDYFDDFTFGSTISFAVSLYGPALSAPDGVSTSGSTFSFSMFFDPAGTFPVLTNDSTNGIAFSVAVNLDGTTTVTNSSSQTSVAVAPPTAITIQTTPPGRQFVVDTGTAQTAPQTVDLSQGMHTITVGSPQPGGAGTQYVFAGWSDGTVSAADNITVGSSPATYTASFATQYQLTISASPTAGGTVTPVSGGFYNSGTVVPITATANGGHTFVNWSGSVASASSASTTVTMSGPETVAANFSSLSTPAAFFTGEVSLGSGVYYLQFPDGIPFGYYSFVAGSLFYHYDMGYEAFIPGSAADVYLYDFATNHWWYTSSGLFPYLYDFTLNAWIYCFANTASPGHYTSNPRYFSNLTTGMIFTM